MLYETLSNGNLLFDSWDFAVAYVEQHVKTNFRIQRREDGKVEVTIWK